MQTRADAIRQQRLRTFHTPVPPDTDPFERAVLWAYDKKIVQLFTTGWKGFSPITGGMVAAAGIPVGVEYLRLDPLGGRMRLRSSARLSIGGYELFDFDAGMPGLAGGKVYSDIYLRYRNYPQLDYYGPGSNSSIHGRSNYRLEDSQADLSVGVRPAKWLRVGVAGGYYRANVGPGTSTSIISADRLYSNIQAPGIQTQTDYLRGGPVLHIDYRDNPYAPRAGGQYYARFDYYRDRQSAGYTFRRLTSEVQQFIPLFNRKRVIALRAKSVMSLENPNQRLPFYLQPSLGGADTLRGFRSFRFYDANSIVYNAEWRWELMSGLDAAAFYDTGKVMAMPGNLSFRHLEHSIGGGFRIRAPVTGAVIARFDAAFSREGVQFSLAFWDIFATPQVRTGRELSPPPGRLP